MADKPVPPRPFYFMRFFSYSHLPEDLQEISKLFHDLAHSLYSHSRMGDKDELIIALRKLLEAKDAAVRASLK